MTISYIFHDYILHFSDSVHAWWY